MAIDEEVQEKLRQTSTATIATVLFKRGFRNVFMIGPKRLNDDVSPVMVGEAFTLRYIPGREDLNGPAEFTERHPQRRAVEECPPGAVVVADCHGDTRSGTGGDILLTRMEVRGCAGMVSDGAVRDIRGISPLKIPVYASAVSAPASFTHFAAVDLQVPIGCGGVAVYPGDVLVGDRDGVVVIPAEIATEVANEALDQERFEAWVIDEVKEGRSTFGLYPPNDETKTRYEQSRR